MSANGTIVTPDGIKPFKGTGWVRSSPAGDINASKQKFLDNYDAGNFSDDIKAELDKKELSNIEPVESCKATPECTIYNYIIPDKLLKDPTKKGRKNKIDRRIFNEAQQASKIDRINQENSSNISSLNTTIQSKSQEIGSAEQNIENLKAQILQLEESKAELENNLKSLKDESIPVETLEQLQDQQKSKFPITQEQRQETTQALIKLDETISKKQSISVADLEKMTSITSSIVEEFDNFRQFPLYTISEYVEIINTSETGPTEDHYFMFFNKINPEIFLVGKQMKYYDDKELKTAVKFISNFGTCNYCSISKLEKYFHFLIEDDNTREDIRLLFDICVKIQQHAPQIMKDNLESFQNLAQYNMLSSQQIEGKKSTINTQITQGMKGMKGFKSRLLDSFSGGRTRRRIRKTRRHATKKRRRQLKTHRRKGRREKRKLTRRR